MTTNTETSPKYELGYTQSVSSGIIAFHGTLKTDNFEDLKDLSKILSLMEASFRNKGYRVASDIEPKESNKKEAKK